MYGLRALGTLPYTGQPEMAVNGTANYFCTLNGTSYFTAPTLGNLLTVNKIRVVIKQLKVVGDGFIFSQSGAGSAREFGVLYSGGSLNYIYGSSTERAILTTAETSSNFGSGGYFDLTFDNTANTVVLRNNVGGTIKSVSLVKGSSRIDGMLFRLGARCGNDTTDTSGGFITANGTWIGDVAIYINDVLVRNYKNTNGSGAGYVDVLQPRPFALRYNAGGNRYMALPQAIIIANNQDFEIEFECAFNNDTDFRIFGATAGVNNRVILLKGTGATVVRLTPTGGNANEWTVTYTKTEFNVFRFKRVSNVIELFVNGVSQGTKTEADGFTSGINSFFTQGGYYSDSGTVRFLKFTIGGVLQHHYVNLTGSGTSWTDIVSGNNATPINTWPTDNSQWIEYAHLQQRGTFTIDNNEWRQFIVPSIVSSNPIGNFTTQSTAASACTFNVLHRFDLTSSATSVVSFSFSKRVSTALATVQGHISAFSFSVRHSLNALTSSTITSAFTGNRFSASYGSFTTNVTVSFQSTGSKRLAQAISTMATASDTITFSKRTTGNLSSFATALGALEFKIRHSFTGATSSSVGSILGATKRVSGAFNIGASAIDNLTWRKRSILNGTTTHTNIGAAYFAKRVSMVADTLVLVAMTFEGFNPRNSIDIPIYAYSANIDTQYWNSADITSTFSFSAVLESIYEF